MIPDGCHLVNGKLPWGQLPPFNAPSPHSHIIYRPFRGWDQNRWFDGPTFVRLGGIVQRYQLPGAPATLTAPTQATTDADLSAWIREREIFAWKKSLAFAFREHLTLKSSAYHLQGLQAGPVPALILLGLRIAFPGHRFFLFDLPGDMKPQWKRYGQNLNLETWASPAQRQSLTQLDLSSMYGLWDKPTAANFLVSLNQKIPVLPQSLCNMFGTTLF